MGESVRSGPGYRKIRIGLAAPREAAEPLARAIGETGAPVSRFDPTSQEDAAAFAGPLTHLFSVVPDTAGTEALLFARHRILDRAPALEVVVLCALLPPAYVRDLRARVPSHVALVDAPFERAAGGEERGELTFAMGGAAEDVDEVQLILSGAGDRFHHLGPLGAGMTAMALNELVAASALTATRAALDSGAASGIAPERLIELMNDASGHSWVSAGYRAGDPLHEGHAPGNPVGEMARRLDAAEALTGEARDLARAVRAALRQLRPLG